MPSKKDHALRFAKASLDDAVAAFERAYFAYEEVCDAHEDPFCRKGSERKIK